jgi:hypothetical protein
MARSHGTQSVTLAAVGLLGLLRPTYLLSYTTPEPYEIEIVRWTGLGLVCLAAIRPWALRSGAAPARRMRLWTGAAGTTGFLYVVSANPLFLVVAFASVVAATLDAALERSTNAADELLVRLHDEADFS